MADSLIGVRGIEKLSGAGRRALVDTARALGTDPDYLATIISFESAGTFDPAKPNGAGSGAVGLIQFMPKTAALLGTSTAQLARMSQAEQIRGPVFHYLAPHRAKSLEDLYLAVFFPAAIGLSDDAVIGLREGGSDFQQVVYRQNAGFDSNQTGVIRRGDVVRTIRAAYQAGLGRPRVPVPASELWRTTLLLALFGVSAYGVVQWGLRRG